MLAAHWSACPDECHSKNLLFS